MNIPKKELVEFVIAEVLEKSPAMSQRELSDMLNSRMGGRFAVSPSRARRIALMMNDVSVVIHTKRGPVPKRCPACGHLLKSMFIRNLAGRKILYRISCIRCSFSATGKKWIPSRYEFWLRSSISREKREHRPLLTRYLLS